MEIWLPSKARRTHVCRVCGTRLYKDEYERHVVACSNRNEDQLRANSPRTKLPFVFDPEEGDAEFREYAKRTGKWS